MIINFLSLGALGNNNTARKYCKRFFEDLTKEMEIKPETEFGTFDRPNPSVNKTENKDGAGTVKSITFSDKKVRIHFSTSSGDPEIKNIVDLSYLNTDITPAFYSSMFKNKTPQHLIFYLDPDCKVAEITYHFAPGLELSQVNIDSKVCNSPKPSDLEGINPSSLKNVCHLFGLNKKGKNESKLQPRPSTQQKAINKSVP